LPQTSYHSPTRCFVASLLSISRVSQCALLKSSQKGQIDDERVIDIDNNTAIAFVAEGSPVRRQLKAFVSNQQLVMQKTIPIHLVSTYQLLKCAFPQEISEQFYVLCYLFCMPRVSCRSE
jgi:hypothetical protein